VWRLPAVSERPASICAAKGPIIGFQLPGCFAEYGSLPENALVRVAENISDSEAACLQSLSDSVAAVETAEIGMGNSVAIFGQGSMGLECMQIIRSSGAGQIITVDVRDETCAMSKELGADVAINARTTDPVAAIRELTEGNGADVIFECAGGSPKQGLAGDHGLKQAIDAVRSGGKIVWSILLRPTADRRYRFDARSAAYATSSPTLARCPTWNTRCGWCLRAACA